MQIGIICPTKFLDEFASRSKYHLVLAHMIRDDEDYLKFYKYRANRGDYITLDNSAYEVGDGVFTPEDLIDFAVEVGAQEVMAPEKFQDADKTVELLEEFHDAMMSSKKAQEANLKIFAVVHGKNTPSMQYCYKQFLKYADVIGFSCRLHDPKQNEYLVGCNINPSFNSSWEYALMRANFISSLRLSRDVEHHLLGLNHPAELILYETEVKSFLRSNDSSAAYVAGKGLWSLNRLTYKKPTNPIRFDDRMLTVDERHQIHINIDKWELFAS